MKTKRKRKKKPPPKRTQKGIKRKKTFQLPEPDLREDPTVFTVCRGPGGTHHFKSSLPNDPPETEIWLQATIFALGTEIYVKYP